jgi:hypothetical protein
MPTGLIGNKRNANSSDRKPCIKTIRKMRRENLGLDIFNFVMLRSVLEALHIPAAGE